MSSVDTRPVPTNLLRWPKTRDLIMQHKGILLYLWAHPEQTACGCYLMPTDATAADLSMTSPSLADAISEFQRRQLIDCDNETGEILLPDWFRWYFPKTPAARGAVDAAIKRILSTGLRRKVESLYKSTSELRKERGKEKEKVSSYEDRKTWLPKDWWKSETGIAEAAKILGVMPKIGESQDSFMARTREAAANDTRKFKKS